MNRHVALLGVVALALLVAGPASAHHVGDLVFCDNNGNGVFEPPTDTGLAGVTVVRNCSGSISTVVTNALGRYSFSGTSTCTYAVDTTVGPVVGKPRTTPLLAAPPPPTPEHSPFGGYGCGSCPNAFVTTIVADGVYRTAIDTPCAANCQDPACTGGLDPCDGGAPYVGYYGNDFGFRCQPPATSTTATSSTSTTSTSVVTTSTIPGHAMQCFEVDFARFSRLGIVMVDRFGPATIDVEKPKRLCNPASVAGVDPTAPSAVEHLVGYVIKQRIPAPTLRTNRDVTTRFGTVTLDLKRPEILLVPSAKGLTGLPAPLAPPIGDAFKCYRAVRGKQQVSGLEVTDQFGTFTINLKQPYRVCVAVDETGQGLVDPDASLLCYKAKEARGIPPFRGPEDPVFVDNLFQSASYVVNRLHELCVPARVD